MIAFAIAVFFMIASPGPGVLSCAGIGAAFGWRAGINFAMGLCLGQLVVFFAVAAGLDALLFAVPWARTVLFVLSFGFLLYLAARIAFAGSQIGFIGAKREPGLTEGFLLQPINPKAYAVCTAMITGFGFMPDAYWTEVVVKFIILNIIWVPLHLTWIGVGVWLKTLDLPPKKQRVINVFMAAAMLLAVGIAIYYAFNPV